MIQRQRIDLDDMRKRHRRIAPAPQPMAFTGAFIRAPQAFAVYNTAYNTVLSVLPFLRLTVTVT